MRASKKVKGAVLLTAGAALFLGAPTVYAASGGDGGDGGDAGSKGTNSTSGAGSLLGGLQLLNNADLNVPATVCGVGAILALGSGDCDAYAGSGSGGSGGDGGSAVSGTTSGHHSSGGSSSATGGDGGDGGNAGSKGDNVTSGRGSILGVLQVGNNLDLNLPVTACGVGALLARGTGDCDASAGSGNGGSGGKGGSAVAGSSRHGHGGSARGGEGGDGGNAGSKGDNVTSGRGSILGGAQVLNNADLNVPITLCGVALLAASAGCSADVSAGTGNGGDGGNGGGAFVNGHRVGGSAVGGEGGDGGNGGSMGNNVTDGRGSILGGLQLLNNASLNVPVTVCGLALLGRAGCEATVTAGSGNGGNGGNGGSAVGGTRHHWDDDDSGVGSKHRHYQATVVRSANRLPHTGAAGLALIPFGLAMVAGGVALRRRNSAGAEV